MSTKRSETLQELQESHNTSVVKILTSKDAKQRQTFAKTTRPVNEHEATTENELQMTKEKARRGCRKDDCEDDDDTNLLSCSECNRAIHYRCTNLPLYQLEVFLTKNRKYSCVSCVQIRPEFKKQMAGYDLNQSFEVEELTQALKDISLESEKTKTTNESLEDKNRKYQRIIRAELKVKKVNEEIISELKDEIEKCGQRIKEADENETKLKNQIDTLKKSASETVRKSDKNALMKSLDEKFTKFEEALLQVIQNNNQNMEHRINEATKQSQTYADAVMGTLRENEVSRTAKEASNSGDDLRRIVFDAKKEEEREAQERKLRGCNLIIHGVKEQDQDDQPKAADMKYVVELLQVIGAPGQIQTAFRLGKMVDGYNRPIKVTMDSEASRDRIISSLSNLKGLETFKGVRITKDLTITERAQIRDLVKQAKDLNEKEPDNSEFEYKVRTSPKNGLIEIMRLKKRNQLAHQRPREDRKFSPL